MVSHYPLYTLYHIWDLSRLWGHNVNGTMTNDKHSMKAFESLTMWKSCYIWGMLININITQFSSYFDKWLFAFNQAVGNKSSCLVFSGHAVWNGFIFKYCLCYGSIMGTQMGRGKGDIYFSFHTHSQAYAWVECSELFKLFFCPVSLLPFFMVKEENGEYTLNMHVRCT